MRLRPSSPGFTIIEVMVAAALIGVATGSIIAMNSQAFRTLRASHLAAASSQVLQQRVEMIRARPWAEIASATALARLMSTPTESEPELSSARVQEAFRMSIPSDPPNTSAGTGTFSVRRAGSVATIEESGDLSAQPTLLVEGTLTWRDGVTVRQRVLRTIVCRAGLTRSGIFGSGLGRPAAPAAVSPAL